MPINYPKEQMRRIKYDPALDVIVSFHKVTLPLIFVEERLFLRNPIVWHKSLFVVVVLLLATATAQAQGTKLYWGDTHLHTSNSTDAYSTGTFNADPDTAYRFAKGLPVLHLRFEHASVSRALWISLSCRIMPSNWDCRRRR